MGKPTPLVWETNPNWIYTGAHCTVILEHELATLAECRHVTDHARRRKGSDSFYFVQVAADRHASGAFYATREEAARSYRQTVDPTDPEVLDRLAFFSAFLATTTVERTRGYVQVSTAHLAGRGGASPAGVTETADVLAWRPYDREQNLEALLWLYGSHGEAERRQPRAYGIAVDEAKGAWTDEQYARAAANRDRHASGRFPEHQGRRLTWGDFIDGDRRFHEPLDELLAIVKGGES